MAPFNSPDTIGKTRMFYFMIWAVLYGLSYSLTDLLYPAAVPYAAAAYAVLLLAWLRHRRLLKVFRICKPVFPVRRPGLSGQTDLPAGLSLEALPKIRQILMAFLLLILPAANLLSGGSFADVKTMVLMAGTVIVEEVFFRGVLLAEKPLTTWMAAKPEFVRAAISSGLFSVFHAVNAAGGEAWLHVLPQMICAFCAGMLFAAVTLRTDSLIPAAAGHYFVNMTAAEENVFSLPVAAGSAICLLAGILLLSRPRERKADRG